MNSDPKQIRSILIIDDDLDDYDLAVEAIEKFNPDVSVSFLPSCKEVDKYYDKSFDLILLDINMPMHDGFEWLQGIKKKGYNIPVVMYTNSSFQDHITRAFEEGASLYFIKPDNFNNMIKGFQMLFSLNWKEPAEVKRQYLRDGKYKAFKVD